MAPLFAFNLFGLGLPEMLVIGVVGVLLFGKKLPDVGKSLAKTIRGFQQGMKGLEDGVDDLGTSPTAHAAPAPTEAIRPPQRVAATAPKFEDAPANPPQV